MNNVNVCTHSGIYHADEVMAIAIIKAYYGKRDTKVNVERSRDPDVWVESDILVDVGREYNPNELKFDHHQGGDPNIIRDPTKGTEYSSAGLVWKHFGPAICGEYVSDPHDAIDLFDQIDKTIIQPIDAIDTGYGLDRQRLEFSKIIATINGTMENGFDMAVDIAGVVLHTAIVSEAKILKDRPELFELIRKQRNQPYLISDRFITTRGVTLPMNMRRYVFKDDEGRWMVSCIRPDGNFTDEIRGATGEQLAERTGISDVLFIHTGGHIASAATREAAIALAKLPYAGLEPRR